MQFAAEFPSVIEAKQQVEEIETAIAAEALRITAARERQYAEALERERVGS